MSDCCLSSEQGYPTDIMTEELVTPLDWQAQGMAAGTPFALAHTFAQTGPFRPSNVERRVPGMVFAGSGTVPGVGVPMVLISGKLAAGRVAAYLRGRGDERLGVAGGLADRWLPGVRQADLPVRHDLLLGRRLAPRPQRKHVYAVYALCRLADDIVDLPNGQHAMRPELAKGENPRLRQAQPATPTTLTHRRLGSPRSVGLRPAGVDKLIRRSVRLTAFADRFQTSLVDGGSTDPVHGRGGRHRVTRRIDPECFDRFFGAMAMDLTTSSYKSWEDLRDYMEGSAAVIGEMMLPVLEPISQAAKAPARSLGLAFQLTNFLRDVDEDLDRGRVYMPQEDFGFSMSILNAAP